MISTCRGCGIAFYARRSSRVFCTRECWIKNFSPNSLSNLRHDLPPKSRPWDGKTRPDFCGVNHPRFGKKCTYSSKVSDGLRRAWKRGDFPASTIEKRAITMRRIAPTLKCYKGGITPLNRSIRAMFQMRNWKRSVFKRDNWTCQSCFKRGGDLNAHHLMPFAYIMKKYSIQSISDAIKCEQLWDVKNGLTMCIDCHNLTKGICLT